MTAARGSYRGDGAMNRMPSHPLTLLLNDSDLALLTLVLSSRAMKGLHDSAQTIAREALGNYLVDSFELLTGQRWGAIYARMAQGEVFTWERDGRGGLRLVSGRAA